MARRLGVGLAARARCPCCLLCITQAQDDEHEQQDGHDESPNGRQQPEGASGSQQCEPGPGTARLEERPAQDQDPAADECAEPEHQTPIPTHDHADGLCDAGGHEEQTQTDSEPLSPRVSLHPWKLGLSRLRKQ